MSKIWREIANPEKHYDFIGNQSVQGIPIEKSRDNLIEKWVYLAEVLNFTFQFANLEQVKECKAYFEKKVHPSTKAHHPKYEHYWQSWNCKLPKGMTKEGNRQIVVNALDKILEKCG